MCKQQSWSEQYNFRRAVAARFGRVFELPLARRVRDVLLDVVRDDHAVLEVGAGDRRMSALLAQHRRGVDYRSMDIDPRGDHDYGTLEEVDRAFNCIFSFEVAEHIAFDELPSWFDKLAALLKPGGHLALSTPNTFYPPAYLRDASHCTPLCYDELGGMLEARGLRVTRIVRIYNDPVWRRIARRWLFGWLFRLIGIDFARQIVVVAQKPE
jgi:2-polyprenyl-3-methyl-5-hydroxy-6-metoxy-1,4-benzoquinol methylase